MSRVATISEELVSSMKQDFKDDYWIKEICDKRGVSVPRFYQWILKGRYYKEKGIDNLYSDLYSFVNKEND